MTKKKQRSTTAATLRSVASNWVGRFVSFALTFIVTPILITGLGNETYGLWSIVMSLTSYYAIADMGFHAATMKYLAEFSARGEVERLQRLVMTGRLINYALSVLVVLAAALAAALVPLALTISETSLLAVRAAVLLTGCTVATRFAVIISAAALKANNRFDLTNAISVVCQIIQSGLMIAAVKSGGGLLEMAVVNLGVGILAASATACMGRRYLPGSRWYQMRLYRAELGLFANFGALSVVSAVASRLARNASPLLIGIVMGPATVTFFTLAEALIKKITSLTKSVTGVLLPVASKLEAEQRREDLLRMAIQVPRVLLTLSLCCTVIFVCFGRAIIDQWIGPGYSQQSYPVLVILSFAFAATMVSGGLTSIMTGTGDLSYVTRVHVVRAVTALLIGIPLLWFFGLPGIACAILFNEAFCNCVQLPLFLCNKLECRYRRFMREVLVAPAFVATICALLAVLQKAAVPPTNIIITLSHAALVLIEGGILAFLLCLDPQLQRMLWKSIAARRSPERHAQRVKAQ